MLCHCGKPLHYSSKETELQIQKLVDEKGPLIPVVRTRNGQIFMVPRHYIALHGLQEEEIDKLGFEQVLEVFVVYERPKDFPNHFVVRPQYVAQSGIVYGEAMIVDSLDAARASIPSDKVCIARHPDDDPKIVETWI